MKKTGLIIIFLIALLIIAFSSVTFAFYSSARAKFSFVVESEVGQSIGLSLASSNNTLRPADTSSAIKDYSKSSADTHESYAVYILQYNAASTLDIDFFVTNVEYLDKNGNSFNAGYEAYLDSILQYYLVLASDLNTYNLNNLHTIADNAWLEEDEHLNEASLAQGNGYLFCYVRLNTTQELLPPIYDDMTISFMVSSELRGN
ncbi:MAG: hypothetical protein K5923_04815 [Clostridia bacterium]|nr:hypothetical protein [Clostridia bacterium]